MGSLKTAQGKGRVGCEQHPTTALRWAKKELASRETAGLTQQYVQGCARAAVPVRTELVGSGCVGLCSVCVA